MNLSKLLSFEQGRITFFETLTKHPENWQQNPTPLCIVRKMLDKTSLEDKKILVLFNIEFLQVLVEERKINPKNIYYIADNELEYLSAIKIFKVQSYKLSDSSVPALKKLIAGIDMKFDVVFSNPPYNRGIDIKIINEIIDAVDEFIIVHPSSWLLDRKNKTSAFVNFKTKIDKKIESFELFNGNPIFNIGLYVPCVITHYKKNHSGDAVVNYFDEQFYESDINEITKFGSNWNKFVKGFYNVVVDYMIQNSGSVWNKNVKSHDNTHFYCQLASIRGHVIQNSHGKEIVKDDFYTMCMKDNENKGVRIKDLQKPGNPIPTFEFGTELERDNFIKYLKTDFARFCLSLLKNNCDLSVGNMELIPWLDFTEEWDDDKLFAKFDVSQELQDYIKDFLPDYYGIRK
jgi:16S rRNA G966 N2-methylase RsmD